MDCRDVSPEYLCEPSKRMTRIFIEQIHNLEQGTLQGVGGGVAGQGFGRRIHEGDPAALVGGYDSFAHGNERRHEPLTRLHGFVCTAALLIKMLDVALR